MTKEALASVISKPVLLDFGMEYFAKHPSGIGLREEGVALLQEVAKALQLWPQYKLHLEGHVPGQPEEDDPIRRSVAEEAAELCREQLQLSGVQNKIVCEGRGSAAGMGLCVHMSTVNDADEKQPAEQAEPAQALPAKGSLMVPPSAARIESDLPPSGLAEEEEGEVSSQPLIVGAETQGFAPHINIQPVLVMAETQALQPLLEAEHTAALQPSIENAETQALESPFRGHSEEAETLQPAETQAFSMSRKDLIIEDDREEANNEEKPAFDVPDDARSMSKEAQRQWLDDFFNMVEREHPLSFGPNKASVDGGTRATVIRLAEVLRTFPGTPVKVVGHSKGKIQDNKESKRVLSRNRAEAVAEVLKEHGVMNEVSIAGYGSALGRGMLVRLHVMTDEEVESGHLHIPDVQRLSHDEQMASLNQLLKEAVADVNFFEPSRVHMLPDGEETVKYAARILMDFPPVAILCEGHSKGKPMDNNDAKVQLSKARADLVTRRLQSHGATNRFVATGCGSSRGGGMRVRLIVWDESKEIRIPDTSGLSEAETRKVVDDLLEQTLRHGINFIPNRFDIPPESYDTVQAVAQILRAFPGFAFRCEGHTKGDPNDNDDAKRHLSLLRAETVKVALRAQGINNDMHCVGEGSARGRGMGIIICVSDAQEATEEDQMPDTTGMSKEEAAPVLDALLEKILSRGIAFEPNAERLPPTAADTVLALAKALKAFEPYGFAMCCEGHAKGQKEQDTEMKRKLSYRRAESLKASLKAQGVRQYIQCVGVGSLQGRGMRVRMFIQSEEELVKDDIEVPDLSGTSHAEKLQLLTSMLDNELQRSKLSFEPNRVDLSAEGMRSVRRIAHLLKAFPDTPLMCEGHSKGKPEDNNSDKVKLSEVRAQAVKVALAEEGAPNEIAISGRGCEMGLGMRVCLFPQAE